MCRAGLSSRDLELQPQNTALPPAANCPKMLHFTLQIGFQRVCKNSCLISVADCIIILNDSLRLYR